MSRSGYIDDMEDQWAMIRYRGQVASAINGKRGQAFLRDLLAALDVMPEKRLVSGVLEDGDNVCAIGALGRAREVDMSELDPDDSAAVSATFNIADQLAREVVYMNDECYYGTSEERWHYMRDWIASQIKKEKA